LKPLRAQRVLVTRARKQAGELASALRQLGATVLEVPVIEICPPQSFRRLDRALRLAGDYQWLILTSVNGVQALLSRLDKFGLTKSHLEHLRIAAIGPATRAEIEQGGLAVSVTPKKYVAEAVVDALRGEVRGKRVLLVRARVARDVIPQELRLAGATVEVVEAYQTLVPPSARGRLRQVLTDMRQRPTTITFTSSSTARNFVGLLGNLRRDLLDGITMASIGPVTSSTLRELGLPTHVEAREYTVAGLVEALAEYFSRT
jgi:uroporphyrinogen-III synthase